MNTVLIACAIIAFCFMSMFYYFARKINKAQKHEKEVLEEYEQKQKEKNELKEKMETGSAVSDFNNSVDILHNLANKKK